ncbi:MAG: hypothetical protein HOW73_47765 [Polyangiaceae bacterium]|nr:hypothetical protein [Polyangiaceae bacterium]
MLMPKAALRAAAMPAPTRNPRARGVSNGGRRADLENVYFRSAWEANYARYLNLLKRQNGIVRWEYEAHTFVFEKISRGNRTYTPDFKVTYPDGHIEWHEVKGWMDQPSKTRLARMARYFPTEKVVVIGAGWFKAAAKGVAHVIPGWERPRSGARAPRATTTRVRARTKRAGGA